MITLQSLFRPGGEIRQDINFHQKGEAKKQYVNCPWLQPLVFISTSHAPPIRDRDRQIGSLVELKQFLTVISSYGHSQVVCTRTQFSHPKARSENIFFALWISRLQSKMQWDSKILNDLDIFLQPVGLEMVVDTFIPFNSQSQAPANAKDTAL